VTRNRSLSGPTIRILGLMLQNPTAEYYGLDLSQRAGLLTGTVYPLLQRLEGRGWMDSRREDVDPSAAGRPARRLYRLTGTGVREARRELNELEAVWRPMTANAATM
jgi:DNA-binding PadR family transcriptional regulator